MALGILLELGFTVLITLRVLKMSFGHGLRLRDVPRKRPTQSPLEIP